MQSHQPPIHPAGGRSLLAHRKKNIVRRETIYIVGHGNMLTGWTLMWK
jgi:hypothetical protein